MPHPCQSLRGQGVSAVSQWAPGQTAGQCLGMVIGRPRALVVVVRWEPALRSKKDPAVISSQEENKF